MKCWKVIGSLLMVAALPAAAFSTDEPESQPRSTLSAYDQGRVEARLGNWSEAVAFFRRAANQNGSDFRAFNMLGYSLRHTGDLAGALKAYNRALTMKPDYAQALEYRGMAHIKMRNKKAALVDYNKLVRLGSPLAADLKEAIDKTAKN